MAEQNKNTDGFGSIAEHLAKKPDLSVPSFDASWLSQSPEMRYDPPGRVLPFVAKTGFWAAAAAVLIGIGFYFTNPSFQAEAPELYGAATGDGVTVENTQKLEWHMGQLQPGDSVNTRESTVDLASSNGILFRAYPHSSFKISMEGGALTLEQTSGRILAEVDPDQGAVTRFRIITPHAKVNVIGTIFETSVSEEGTEVYLQRGKIELSGETIEPGQLARKPAQSGLAISNEPERGTALEPEIESLRNNTDQLINKWVPDMKRLDQVRSEEAIKQMYGQSLEKILLKDGRILQGVVASQQGDRLMLHTTSGVVVVRRQDVQEILYEN
ncbi:MAG: FecR domain-containing protein [Leptospiraceae bacterium]|nr:FecR domain-containing protein [Leptospiraceae bacterium]